MVGAQISPVLLVGEVAPRLQAELALQGLPCAVAFDQNEAVARMRSTLFPFVVVPSVFVDGYSGVSFTQGLLQYFDTQVIVYGNGLEQHDLSALLRTGRVAHFPADAEGRIVADFLARRTRGNSNPPTPASATPHPYNLTPGGPLASAVFPAAPTTDPTLSPAFFGGAAAVPRPPTMGPTPGMVVQAVAPAAAPPEQRLEAVVDELVRTQAELQAVRGRAAHIDQERAALLVEVEAARRTSMAQVAEVMALSDEGDPISEELEELRARAANLENDVGAARGEVEMLRAERERLVAEAAAQAGALAQLRERADAADALLKESHDAQLVTQGRAQAAQEDAQRLRTELERANAEATSLRGELAGRQALEPELVKAKADLALEQAARSALEHNQAAEVGALEQRLAAEVGALEQKLAAEVGALEQKLAAERSAIEQQLSAERSAHSSTLEQQRADLEMHHGEALAKAAQQARSAADEGAALRVETNKLKGDLSAARTDATTLRLDLQEATMRLDEATQQLAAIGGERDALRSEAAPLREWANQLVLEHARQQEELERLRAAAEKLEDRARLIDELQAQLQLITAERDRLKAQGGGAPADVEVVVARARQLAALVGALEPFMWGLTQAAQFFTKHTVEGGDQHVKLLQQLQGVLLRLRDEIAMLDLG